MRSIFIRAIAADAILLDAAQSQSVLPTMETTVRIDWFVVEKLRVENPSAESTL
jgi:hypothetical protein